MMEIDPETVYFLILKAREFDDKDEPGDLDPEEGPADVALRADMQYFDDDPVAQELKDAIDGLNDDHQVELVALTWLGRGDFGPDDWAEAVKMARERRTTATSEYLIGTPLLGDYLEEGLTKLGVSIEDLEAARP